MERGIRIILRLENPAKEELHEMNEKVKDVSDSSFEHEVLGSKKPVLVDFWAAWCAPCRTLAPTVAAIAEEYLETAAVVKLNVDDNPSTAESYGIKGIPTLILFNAGKEVERLIGVTSKAVISSMIKKYSSLPSSQSQIA